MENTPQKVTKSISNIANCHGSILELRILPIQQQKNSIDCGIFAVAHAIKFLHGENVESSSFDVTLMCDQFVCSCKNFHHFQRPIKEFNAVDLFLCFLMCTVGVPTFMMMLNQATDILW